MWNATVLRQDSVGRQSDVDAFRESDHERVAVANMTDLDDPLAGCERLPQHCAANSIDRPLTTDH